MGTEKTMAENRRVLKDGEKAVLRRLNNLSESNKQLNIQVEVQQSFLKTNCRIHGVDYETVRKGIKEAVKAILAKNKNVVSVDGEEIDGGWV